MGTIRNWAVGAVLALAAILGLVLIGVRFVPAVQDKIVALLAHDAFAVQRDDLLGDDALRVAICGSGSPMADPDRAPACNLVFAGGRIFMVDVGPGSFERVQRWHLPVGRIGQVFLTHFHSDHIGDLGEANLETWVGGRSAPLAVYGGPGVEDVVAGFNQAYGPDGVHRVAHHGPDFLPPDLHVMQAHLIADVSGKALTGMQSAVVYDAGGVKVTAFAVDHKPVVPAYGYRFDYKGRSVVFSGDTVKSANLLRNAQGADLLIHEAMLKDIVWQLYREARAAHRDRNAHILHDIPSYHSSPRDAAETARDAHVSHLVLNHLIPPIPSFLAEPLFLRDARFSGLDTRLAFDGMLMEMSLASKDFRVSDLGK